MGYIQHECRYLYLRIKGSTCCKKSNQYMWTKVLSLWLVFFIKLIFFLKIVNFYKYNHIHSTIDPINVNWSYLNCNKHKIMKDFQNPKKNSNEVYHNYVGQRLGFNTRMVRKIHIWFKIWKPWQFHKLLHALFLS